MSREKVLIIGASGLLGETLSIELQNDFDVYGTFLHHRPLQLKKVIQLDASDDLCLENCIQSVLPRYVINCSGLTSVEECEARPEASWILNAYVPTKTAAILEETSSRFIHISTDHFESQDSRPRTEIDEVWSVNQYGYSKLCAESSLLSANPTSLVIRTNFFGLGKKSGNSLLDFAVKSIRSNSETFGFDDVQFSPVSTTFLSSAIAKLLSKEVSGVLNIASSQVISKYDFLLLVADVLNKDHKFVKRSSSSNFQGLTPRPRYLALDPSRLLSHIDASSPSIRDMIECEVFRDDRLGA